MYPFVLAQIFAVFFAIAKNSANISEKNCADIYENIRVAKNCASLIFPQIFSQILAQINSGNKFGAKNTANICGNYCDAQILPQNKAQIFADRK